MLKIVEPKKRVLTLLRSWKMHLSCISHSNISRRVKWNKKNFQDIDIESSLKALSRSRDAADITPHIICTEVSLSPFTHCFHVNFTP